MTSFVPVLIGTLVDREDELDTVQTANAVVDALRRLGHRSQCVTVGLDLSTLAGLVPDRPLAVFNLVESIAGDAGLGHLACPVLDHLGLAYTGAPTAAYIETGSKLLTKVRLAAEGIATPRWWLDGDAVPPDATVIVKSVQEHGSLGMDADSVVAGPAAAGQIAMRQRRFGGRFFAEEFAGGREFNIAILEIDGRPTVLPIAEMQFAGFAGARPRIMDYAAKWDGSDPAYRQSGAVFGLEAAEAELAAELAAMALRCWSAFGLAGYARVDIRLSAGGRPLVLEVNANPCLAQEAGFALALARTGRGYDRMIADIVAAARSGPKAGL